MALNHIVFATNTLAARTSATTSLILQFSLSKKQKQVCDIATTHILRFLQLKKHKQG